jgi:hypothetical protein
MLALCIVLPIVVLWIGCVIDVIGRPDISGLTKAGWMLFIIFLPLAGAIVYTIARPRLIAAKNVSSLEAVNMHGRDPEQEQEINRSRWGSYS